jgi:sterol 14-demethylase
MLVIIFVGVVGVLLTIWSLFFKRRPANSPPIASLGVPIFGTFIEFGKNPVNFIESCRKKYGEIYTVPMLHKNLTFLLGPEVSTPFFKLSDDFMSQNEVYGFMTPVFGKNVVYDAEPKKRIQQYQSMSNGLRGNRLKSYIPKIEKELMEYVAQWGESGTINILEALSELTILTSSRCLHGDDVRESLFADVSRLYHDLDKGITPLSFFFPYAPTAAHKKRDNARKEMVQIFSKIINARRYEDKEVTANRTDIIQIFVDMVYKEDGSKLKDEEVVGLLIALLFAGQHTSSITSTWTIMLLLHNPDCMAKVLEEQKATLTGKPFDYDSVGEMEYLQNCVKESLRLFPPLIMLMRMAMQDIPTTCNGKSYIIPKGDIVVTSPAVASRMESVFKNANNFEPDRFSPERNEQATPYAYLGFLIFKIKLYMQK